MRITKMDGWSMWYKPLYYDFWISKPLFDNDWMRTLNIFTRGAKIVQNLFISKEIQLNFSTNLLVRHQYGNKFFVHDTMLLKDVWKEQCFKQISWSRKKLFQNEYMFFTNIIFIGEKKTIAGRKFREEKKNAKF